MNSNAFERIELNPARGVQLLRALQPQGLCPAVLLLPGGRYRECNTHLVLPAARRFWEAGWHCFILEYSVREHRTWPQPLEDWTQAMTLLHEHQKDWRLAPGQLAALGFSSGGHLAAAGTLLCEPPLRPDALLLAYPVLGEAIHLRSELAPELISKANASCPPCFLVHSLNDPQAPPEDSLAFAARLQDQKVPLEAHFFSRGGHGFGDGDAASQPTPEKAAALPPRLAGWVDMAIEWLGETLAE